MSAVPVPNGRRGFVARHVGDLFATPVAVVETPASHRDDPETSRMAEEVVTVSGKRTHQQAQVLAAVREWPGRTSAELAVLMKAPRHLPARRLRELVTAGVVDMGDRRLCTACGSECRTWFPKGENR